LHEKHKQDIKSITMLLSDFVTFDPIIRNEPS